MSGTTDWKLTYGKVEKNLEGYADADGSMHEDHKAISGYMFMIDCGAVSWCMKKQEIISLSTTKAKYVAATHAVKEALWLQSLIGKIYGNIKGPITLYSNNQSAIALMKDHQYHMRTKHIDVQFHFIQWVIKQGKIKLVYCPTNNMLANTFTKDLAYHEIEGECWNEYNLVMCTWCIYSGSQSFIDQLLMAAICTSPFGNSTTLSLAFVILTATVQLISC